MIKIPKQKKIYFNHGNIMLCYDDLLLFIIIHNYNEETVDPYSQTIHVVFKCKNTKKRKREKKNTTEEEQQQIQNLDLKNFIPRIQALLFHWDLSFIAIQKST